MCSAKLKRLKVLLISQGLQENAEEMGVAESLVVIRGGSERAKRKNCGVEAQLELPS